MTYFVTARGWLLCGSCAHLIGYPCASACAIQCKSCGRDDRYGDAA